MKLNRSSHRNHIVLMNISLRRRMMVCVELLAVSDTQSAFSTSKSVDETLTELCAHEAVGDGIAAGRHERQQVDVVHGGRRHMRHRVEVVEHAPCLHHVHRSPADEEQQNDNGEHLNTTPLGSHAACAQTSRCGGARRRSCGDHHRTAAAAVRLSRWVTSTCLSHA